MTAFLLMVGLGLWLIGIGIAANGLLRYFNDEETPFLPTWREVVPSADFMRDCPGEPDKKPNFATEKPHD